MGNIEDNFMDYESLIIKYLANTISEKELEELQSWIDLSEENKTSFHRFKSAWFLAGMPNYPHQYNVNLAYSKISSQLDPLQKSYKLIARLKKYAAVGIICFALGGFMVWLFGSIKPEMNHTSTTISAPLGAKSVVDLPDGTKVWLNAGSRIKYDGSYGIKNRIVMLTGEAYFDVAKNKKVPFLVKTSKITVRALGTKFNVKAYPEERIITATLEEGQIEVSSIDKKQNHKTVILKPQESIVYYIDANRIKKDIANDTATTNEQTRENLPNSIIEKNVNTTLYTSWKDDKWILERITLGSLGTLIERRYNVIMVFNDPSLKMYKFTGTIENQPLEQILNAFKFTAPVDYKISKDTVFLDINKSQAEKFKSITGEK